MEEKEFGKRGEWIQLAIQDLASGKLAQETLKSLLSYLFLQRNVHRIFGISDVDNGPSIQLLKNLHFRLEGQMKKSLFNGGRWRDEVLYAILAEEFLLRFKGEVQ